MYDKLQVGDIYLVKFHPSSGRQLKKYRPAVIVNTTITDIDSRFCLVAPFTSSKKQNNWELTFNNTALNKESTLLCWYLETIDVRTLERKLGSLSPQERKEMEKVMRSLLNA